MNPQIAALLADAFWSAIAAAGFAILFNVPPRALPGCALAAAIGHALRTWAIQQGLPIEPATLLAATTIGFLGVYLARWFQSPTAIFTVPAVIPMVPGTFAFRTMLGILQLTTLGINDSAPILAEVSLNAIKTGLILAALAGGIIAPRLLFRRQKPVV
ncbi:MAG: threonine/serine exporter family protein [Ardenticatenaceae bacterium]|nr:threonine/serine exporter family protein [Ardenticatenaceae bacterium]MCB8947329.1 threonine/serine exporter family protein [Ardenticatenaceae bacterium]